MVLFRPLSAVGAWLCSDVVRGDNHLWSHKLPSPLTRRLRRGTRTDLTRHRGRRQLWQEDKACAELCFRASPVLRAGFPARRVPTNSKVASAKEENDASPTRATTSLLCAAYSGSKVVHPAFAAAWRPCSYPVHVAAGVLSRLVDFHREAA